MSNCWFPLTPPPIDINMARAWLKMCHGLGIPRHGKLLMPLGSEKDRPRGCLLLRVPLFVWKTTNPTADNPQKNRVLSGRGGGGPSQECCALDPGLLARELEGAVHELAPLHLRSLLPNQKDQKLF